MLETVPACQKCRLNLNNDINKHLAIIDKETLEQMQHSLCLAVKCSADLDLLED